MFFRGEIMRRITNYFKDTIKVTVIASIVSLILSLVISFVQLLAYGINIIKILEGIRMILFIVGSLGLLLWALFIIKKKNNAILKHERQWRSKFSEFNFETVLLIFSSIILFYGITFDLILFNSL
jgi:uncharacterized protein with PQ loop repeat